MTTISLGGDGYLRARDAAAQGLSVRQLDRAVSAGLLVRVGRGVYAPPADRWPSDAHRLRVLAMDNPAGAVVSHASAATLHGLPMLRPDLSRLHLTSPSSDRGYKRKTRHLHPGNIAAADAVVVDGVRATSVERTAFDVARTSTQGFAGALAVLDGALRCGADRSRMEAYGREPRTGVGVAREALRHADGLAENPGESWSRAQLILNGIPIHRLQTEVFDKHGRFVARPDFDWVDDDGRILVVGEFDGLEKYVKYLKAGEDTDSALRREKERESRLQDLGIIVVRWTWTDLCTPKRVPNRVRIQLQRAGLL